MEMYSATTYGSRLVFPQCHSNPGHTMRFHVITCPEAIIDYRYDPPGHLIFEIRHVALKGRFFNGSKVPVRACISYNLQGYPGEGLYFHILNKYYFIFIQQKSTRMKKK